MISSFNEPPWYGDCPADWRMVRVKDSVNSIDSGVWGDDSYDEEGSTPVLRSNEIDEGGQWRVTDPARRLLSPVERAKALLRAGDLLLVKSSGSQLHVGKTAVVTKQIEEIGCCYSNFTSRLRSKQCSANSRFLWYYLNNSPGRDQLFYHGTTTTGLINLTATSIGIGKIALPQLAEQQAIATYLDTGCAAIDVAIASKRKQIESLTGIRKSLLQRVVTRGISQTPALVATGNFWLEQIPQGWSLVMLKRLADIQGGITLGKSYEDVETVEYPYLRVANVQDGYVDLHDVTLLDVPPAVAAGVMLRAGDVLMTEGGDLDKLGRGTVWNGQIEPCLHQNHVFAVRFRTHQLLPHFLAGLRDAFRSCP